MKKTRTEVKSEATRRLRRRLPENPTGPSPAPADGAATGPESPAFWQQLKAIGGDVAPRYRRD